MLAILCVLTGKEMLPTISSPESQNLGQNQAIHCDYEPCLHDRTWLAPSDRKYRAKFQCPKGELVTCAKLRVPRLCGYMRKVRQVSRLVIMENHIQYYLASVCRDQYPKQ